MLFWTNFDPLLCHTSLYPLKYITHLGTTPQFLVVHAYIHGFTWRFVLVLRSFLSRVLSEGFFVWKVLFGVVFVHPPFCQNTSVTTASFNFTFNFLKTVTSHALGPSPCNKQYCHTFSDPPSSVTYFMDSPMACFNVQ